MNAGFAVAALATGLTLPALADFQLLFVEPSGAERPVGAVWDVGGAAPGDSILARFRLRNTGASPANLQVIEIAGVGFEIAQYPMLPQSVPAGAAADFSVAFRPPATGSFSAVLRAEGISVILSGNGVAAFTALLDGQPLRGGATIDFPPVERGASSVRSFVLENRTSSAMLVPEILVDGQAFRLSGVPPSGQRLEPSAAAVCEIRFEPPSAGPQQGTLQIGTRGFVLRGQGIEPGAPAPKLRLDILAARSGQRGSVAIVLDQPAARDASGVLTLDFQPSVAGMSDSAIMFSSGSRELPFTVRQGESAARFSGGDTAAFQTGTTAGTLGFKATLGAVVDRATLAIPPAPPVITAATATRSLAHIEIAVTGYDNTRTAGALAFTFYDKAGNTVPPGAIRSDASAAFRSYFAAPDATGAFAIRAVFGVTGPAEQVDSVDVEIANSEGSVAKPGLKMQ